MIHNYDNCVHFRAKKTIPTVPKSKYYCTLKNAFVTKDCKNNCDNYNDGGSVKND